MFSLQHDKFDRLGYHRCQHDGEIGSQINHEGLQIVVEETNLM